ncbi:hypothetical protein CEP54_005257 [Fusarium duplospermum]|uniref:Cyclase n=1 Tax=Fusarium duplospermum TaxID=1325734 RepID=A0A428QDX8_9HYPO|nr:hypothetical protein CEP54_005257 [Fusarium duplospermum]
MARYVDFDSLPKVEGQPQGCAWGLWGPEDELGTLNYLTPEVVWDTAKEIQTGARFQLDLRLDHFDQRVAGREGFKHQIFDFKRDSRELYGYRHIGIQESAEYYKGTEHQHVVAKSAKGRMGIHKWFENGGIVGRGILLDYHRWRTEAGKPPIPANSTFAITVEELDEVARHQGTEFRPGDILIVRTGFTGWHMKASDEDKKTPTEKGAFIGVESSMASVRWLWNHHFAAVLRHSWLRVHADRVLG